MTGETIEELRRTNYEIAEAVAPGWERRRAFIEEVTAPVREWMIRELEPRSGDTVLELAAGVGDTGFDAAAALGEAGRLISSDFSPSMVEGTRRRGAERGVKNVEYREIDAQWIELDADSVDGVLCRFAYMLMPEPAAALSETRRVLRPGGRLVLAVWGPLDRNPYFATVGMTLVQTGHMPPPDPEGPSVFSMGDEERTRAMLQDAGFEDVRTEEVPVSFRFRDIDEYMEVTTDTAGPIAIILRELSDAELQEVRGRLEEGFAPFATDGGYEIPGLALCAVAS